MMWCTDSDGNVLNEIVAIIDWQVMHEGSPMSDLSYFLTLYLDGVVRRQTEEFAIQYYFDCLVKEFGDTNLVPYTVEKLRIAYDYFFNTHGLHTLGISGFLFKGLNEPNQSVKDAYYDYGILKSLHAREDVDRLLQGKYKHIYEKYQ
uniref:Aminoglycoside phosphotransferase domain-containing protein n=1 Tax=Panagrolaimus sp. PS1159 TaxID=55785 RepID=A0AC35GEC7_9BILA